MPILNLNGTRRKPAVVHSNKPLFHQGQSTNQHPATGVVGKSYESPFTTSANPPLANHINTATQPQLPAMQVTQPGVVVPLSRFQKVHPSEKGKTFNRTTPVRVTNPGGFGSPNKGNDTPANPNAQPKPPARPPRYPTTGEQPKGTTGSFLSVNAGTLHSTQNASSNTSRWNTVKRGVVV